MAYGTKFKNLFMYLSSSSGLHLTSNVSPEVLSQVDSVSLLCLVVSKVNDTNVDVVCDIAKALLPQNSMQVYPQIVIIARKMWLLIME